MGYVWMTLDHRNASEIRLEHILSMTDIIEVPWTRILLTEMDFQGSGQLVLNTLDLLPIGGSPALRGPAWI